MKVRNPKTGEEFEIEDGAGVAEEAHARGYEVLADEMSSGEEPGFLDRVGEQAVTKPLETVVGSLEGFPLYGVADKMSAAYAGATGDKPFKEGYAEALRKQKKALEYAKSKAPDASLVGSIGASLAVPMVPGGAAVKGASTLSKLGRVAKTAATMGAVGAADMGTRGDELFDLEKAKEGATWGAVPVLGTEAAIGAVRGAKAVAKGLGRVAVTSLTGVPKKAMEGYLARPAEAIKSARSLPDIAEQIRADMEVLRQKTSAGSAAGYDLLGKAQGEISPDEARAILERMEGFAEQLKTGNLPGVGTPARASYNKAAEIPNDFRSMITRKREAVPGHPLYPGTGKPATIEQLPLSYEDAKKVLQDLDQYEQIWKQAPGEYTPQALRAIKDMRNTLRGALGAVPGYDQLMADVAENTKLSKNVGRAMGKQPDLYSNRLNLIARDMERKRQSAGALRQLAEKTGSKDYLQEAADRRVLDMFDKDLTRGSRLTNLWGMLMRGAAGGGAAGYGTDWSPTAMAAGAVTGAAMDRYGGQLAMKLMDAVRSRPAQAFGKFGGILKTAAQRGSQSLLFVHLKLLRDEPEYREIISNLEGNQ